MRRLLLPCCFLAWSACHTPAVPTQPPKPPPTALGSPIAPGAPTVALAALAGQPKAYQDKTFTTSGTVTAVCQEMGCWMEIKDDAAQAHIKMAGHGFFVPRSASGRRARVQATLVPTAEEATECNQEAAKQMGRAVSKLQLLATGVELEPQG